MPLFTKVFAYFIFINASLYTKKLNQIGSARPIKRDPDRPMSILKHIGYDRSTQNRN